MDFYGGDLQPVFETSFTSCQQICLADQKCRAFTFNVKSNACFPKSDIAEMKPLTARFQPGFLTPILQSLRHKARAQRRLLFCRRHF